MIHRTKIDHPPGTSLPRQSRIAPTLLDVLTLLMTALVVGGVFYVFHFHGVTDVGYEFTRPTRSVFDWLYNRWYNDIRDTLFAHSHLVPLISLLLVWLDRRALATLPRRINWFGLVLIIFAFVIHWAGVKTEQTRISVASLIMLTWSIPLFICGWPTARRLIFPCGFLIFSLPLNFFDALVHPIRIASVSTATALLNGIGIDVVQAGPVIVVRQSGFRMDLADTRSSIFAATAAGACSLLCAYLARTRLWKRLLIPAICIPLFMTSIVLRALIIMVVGATSPALGARINELLSGPLVVLLIFGGLTGLAISFHEKKPYAPIRDLSNGKSKTIPAIWPLIITLSVIAAASKWIPANLDVHHSEQTGVNLDWPDMLGAWRGEETLYCHNPEDIREVFTTELIAGDPCPNCGEPLFEMSPVERLLLPPDTLVRKKQYESPLGRRVYLAIVLSGKHRSSIHRPEVCLVGPNSRIAESFIHEVELANGRKLRVKVLEMIIQFKGPDGEMYSGRSYYTYWFAGIGRETPSHLQRMFWMASDRLFRNESYRWAYISIAGIRTSQREAYLREIDEFIRLAYPALIRP